MLQLHGRPLDGLACRDVPHAGAEDICGLLLHKLAGLFRSTAAWYVALAYSFSFINPLINRLQCQRQYRKDTMAQDSYSGKVSLALLMGKTMEELMSVWVSRVQEAVWWR